MDDIVNTNNRKRYYLLDGIRGICILGMIIYHTLFDIVFFFGFPVSENVMIAVDIVRDFGACCFIALAGICTHFGKRPLKRFLMIFGASTVVGIVTMIVFPSAPVIFGVLNFMWIASLIIMPLKRLFDKLPAILCCIVCLLLFLLTFEVHDGYLGYYGIEVTALPEVLYSNYFTALLGFPFIGFSSSDYYPLLPWIFMFFFGYFLWNAISEKKLIQKILGFRTGFLEKIGKVSLYIYIAHQPVVMGLLLVITSLFFR